MIVAQGCGYIEMMQSSHRGRSVSHTEGFTGQHYFRKLTPVQGWARVSFVDLERFRFSMIRIPWNYLIVTEFVRG